MTMYGGIDSISHNIQYISHILIEFGKYTKILCERFSATKSECGEHPRILCGLLSVPQNICYVVFSYEEIHILKEHNSLKFMNHEYENCYGFEA